MATVNFSVPIEIKNAFQEHSWPRTGARSLPGSCSGR